MLLKSFALLALLGQALGVVNTFLQLNTAGGAGPIFSGLPVAGFDTFTQIFNWGLGFQSTIPTVGNGGGGGGSGGSGRLVFQSLTITRNIDVFSSQLFTSMALGSPLSGRLVAVPQDGPYLNQALQYTFGQLIITDISWSPNDGSLGQEVITFSYATVAVTTEILDSSGAYDPIATAGWNLITNGQCSDPEAWNCVDNASKRRSIFGRA